MHGCVQGKSMLANTPHCQTARVGCEGMITEEGKCDRPGLAVLQMSFGRDTQ